MALVLADRVLETTTTAGSGTITLAGAKPGYQSFSAIGDGNTTYYTIALQSGTEWEVGIGTYTASGTTLSRDTVLSSSAGGAKVTFSAGTKDVFCDYPAGRAVYGNAAGVVVVSDLNATSATITTVTGTTSKFTNTGDQTTTQFQGASANITTITGTSANITTITGTTIGSTATTQLKGQSASITTISGTTSSYTNVGIQASTQFQGASANITTVTGTTITATNMGAQASTQLQAASANITTATGTTFSATNMGTQASTQFQGASANITTISSSSANITTLTGTSATITTMLDSVGNVRNIPRVGSQKTSVYTLAISDIGQYVEIGTGGGVDVPNGIFNTGNAVTIFNNTTGNRTISLTITTAYIGGTDADKNSVTLATRGLATILFISNSVCVVNGNVT